MDGSYLHIVSLTIPWPPDYGGAIDIWYKLPAFRKEGIRIILHCFEYDRKPDEILLKYCEKVYYYQRKRRLTDFLSLTPFMIKTRESKTLMNNLRKDDHPILLEGIHSISVTREKSLRDRKIWLRPHNVEAGYTRDLARAEDSFPRKLFFYLESLKLKYYERKKLNVKGIFCISEPDKEFFSKYNKNCMLLPPFHAHEKVTSKPGRGKYLLYHGNLSISENRQNALFLSRICHRFPLPLIIAGRSPRSSFLKKLQVFPNATVKTDLSPTDMNALIRDAAMILLPARQTSGFRLKLLSSLYMGRHIIASPQMVYQTGLAALCHQATTENEWVRTIKELSDVSFSEREKENRENVLKPFSNESNAKFLKSVIFPEK
ncbi:MAG: glycosyltransferase [Marinilabilia sp.]